MCLYKVSCRKQKIQQIRLQCVCVYIYMYVSAVFLVSHRLPNTEAPNDAMKRYQYVRQRRL